MKYSLRLFLVIAVFASQAFSQQVDKQLGKKQTVAILPFLVDGSPSSDLGVMVAYLLSASMGRAEQYQLVKRDNIESQLAAGKLTVADILLDPTKLSANEKLREEADLLVVGEVASSATNRIRLFVVRSDGTVYREATAEYQHIESIFEAIEGIVSLITLSEEDAAFRDILISMKEGDFDAVKAKFSQLAGETLSAEEKVRFDELHDMLAEVIKYHKLIMRSCTNAPDAVGPKKAREYLEKLTDLLGDCKVVNECRERLDQFQRKLNRVLLGEYDIHHSTVGKALLIINNKVDRIIRGSMTFYDANHGVASFDMRGEVITEEIADPIERAMFKAATGVDQISADYDLVKFGFTKRRKEKLYGLNDLKLTYYTKFENGLVNGAEFLPKEGKPRATLDGMRAQPKYP